ncbi:MAG: lipoprotein [Halioglobus sp.]
MYNAIWKALLLSGLLLMAGCGQTGPLYLPEAEVEAEEAPRDKPTPVEPEQDQPTEPTDNS